MSAWAARSDSNASLAATVRISQQLCRGGALAEKSAGTVQPEQHVLVEFKRGEDEHPDSGEVVPGGDLGFVRLAKMIHKYRPLILDTLDHGLSNARSEATNLTSNSGVKQGAGQCVDGGVALRPGPAPVAGEADQRLPVAVEGGGQAQCRTHRLFEQRNVGAAGCV